MNRSGWRWARLLGGALVLAALLRQLGTGPFLDGIRLIDGRSLMAAAAITLLTTACCAWRWRLVARGLGIDLTMPTAIGAYYRSQFLNTTLPGGVLGDVHRAVRHGRDAGDVGRGLRAVAWERAAGQVVQVVLAVILLALLPSPVRSSMPVIVAATIVAAVGAVALSRRVPDSGMSLWARALRTSAADLRGALLARAAWPGILLSSAAAVAGHAAIFLIAARALGSTVSPVHMLPLAMLVLLAMSVPTNIAGWGPREGVAAWAFSLAGLGADQGVATAVAYGVMVFGASLPGAVILIGGWLRPNTRRRGTTGSPLWRQSTPGRQGAAHG